MEEDTALRLFEGSEGGEDSSLRGLEVGLQEDFGAVGAGEGGDRGGVGGKGVETSRTLEGRLLAMHTADAVDAEGARVNGALTLASEERFDPVLAWDLVGYLGRDRWPVIARLLVSRLAPGGCLHLLVWSGREMPEQASLFCFGAIDSLLAEIRTVETGPSARFSHAEVERLHPGLAAVRSFLDKHGVQELLLGHAEGHHLPPRAVAQPRM